MSHIDQPCILTKCNYYSNKCVLPEGFYVFTTLLLFYYVLLVC